MKQHTEDLHSALWIENGIAYQVYKPNLVITLDIAKSMVANRRSFFNGQSYPMLVDIRNLVSIDTAARAFFANAESSVLVIACAILLDKPIYSWLANVFTYIDSPRAPTKHFTNKDEAISWLHQSLLQKQ